MAKNPKLGYVHMIFDVKITSSGPFLSQKLDFSAEDECAVFRQTTLKSEIETGLKYAEDSTVGMVVMALQGPMVGHINKLPPKT